MSTGTQTETDAEREVARFLASQPSPEAIVAFHSSPEVATRMYELIEAEREGPLSDEERRELETYFHIEHLMRLVKAEAYRRLGAQAQ
jgi:hypothetical protein